MSKQVLIDDRPISVTESFKLRAMLQKADPAMQALREATLVPVVKPPLPEVAHRELVTKEACSLIEAIAHYGAVAEIKTEPVVAPAALPVRLEEKPAVPPPAPPKATRVATGHPQFKGAVKGFLALLLVVGLVLALPLSRHAAPVKGTVRPVAPSSNLLPGDHRLPNGSTAPKATPNSNQSPAPKTRSIQKQTTSNHTGTQTATVPVAPLGIPVRQDAGGNPNVKPADPKPADNTTPSGGGTTDNRPGTSSGPVTDQNSCNGQASSGTNPDGTSQCAPSENRDHQ